MALLTDGLVSFWNFSEPGTGDRADSVVASAQTLTNPNGCTGVAGPGTNGATSFVTASSQYLTRASGALLQPGPALTLQLWVKFTTLPVNPPIDTGFFYLLNKQVFGQYTFSLLINPVPQIIFATYESDGDAATSISGVTVTTGVWYCIHAWFNPNDGKPHIAINNDASETENPLPISINTGGTADFFVGSYDTENYFADAHMALVGFWTRVLNSNDRVALINGGKGLSYADMVGTQDPDAARRVIAF